MKRRTCGCHSHNGLLLSPEGLAQRELRSTGLTDRDFFAILDSKVSVSALVEVEENHVFDDQLIDQQYRRFLNGS